MSDDVINVEVVDGLPDAPEDGVIYGRRNAEWVDMTGAANLQVNRGTTAEVAAYTPMDGEPVWDSENKLLVMGDDETQGGIFVGSPQRVAYQSTAVAIPESSAGYTNATPLVLSPQNSVWQINYYAVFGGDFTDNANYAVLLGGFSNLSAIDGTVTVIDDGDNVTQKIIQATTTTFASGDGLPCVLHIDGIIRVTGASGTVAIGFSGADTQASQGLARSVLVARRLA